MNYLKRIQKRTRKEGLESTLNYFLRKINLNTKYPTFLDKKISDLSNQIYKNSKGKITNGIYKGLKLTNNDIHGSKIIGEYEKQIQQKILELKKKFSLKNIVNFGSAEGFHILGALKNLNYSKGLAFEKDQEIKKILIKNINLNKLNNKINIYNDASFDKAINILGLKNLNKTLFLIDIEGEEFNLLNKKTINQIKNSFLIIENHDFYIKNKKKIINFFKNLNKHFIVEKIISSPKNPLYNIEIINSFTEIEKWMIISEGRKMPMNWLVCMPKKIRND